MKMFDDDKSGMIGLPYSEKNDDDMCDVCEREKVGIPNITMF